MCWCLFNSCVNCGANLKHWDCIICIYHTAIIMCCWGRLWQVECSSMCVHVCTKLFSLNNFRNCDSLIRNVRNSFCSSESHNKYFAAVEWKLTKFNFSTIYLTKSNYLFLTRATNNFQDPINNFKEKKILHKLNDNIMHKTDDKTQSQAFNIK